MEEEKKEKIYPVKVNFQVELSKRNEEGWTVSYKTLLKFSIDELIPGDLDPLTHLKQRLTEEIKRHEKFLEPQDKLIGE
jgi:hypothetical protein